MKPEWIGYNCGYDSNLGRDEIVDMHPESEFEVSERAGKYLLRTLGAPSWLTPVQEQTQEKEVEVVAEVVKVKTFCGSCDSRGVRHKKNCQRLK